MIEPVAGRAIAKGVFRGAASAVEVKTGKCTGQSAATAAEIVKSPFCPPETSRFSVVSVLKKETET